MKTEEISVVLRFLDRIDLDNIPREARNNIQKAKYFIINATHNHANKNTTLSH